VNSPHSLQELQDNSHRDINNTSRQGLFGRHTACLEAASHHSGTLEVK